LRRHALTIAAAAVLVATGADAAKPPTTWDGLVQVPSKRLDVVYLLPGADFAPYIKVMIDPTEVAFDKGWLRDYNMSTSSLTSRISEKELQKMVTDAIPEATQIFADAFGKGGYQVVTEPGPDVLRVRTGVLNIRVNAPDTRSAGRSYSFAPEAGSATLFVEARDSQTGALLGRAVDGRVIGDSPSAWRTSVSNRGDFRDAVETWAKISVRGLTELKAQPPVK
jgi:hypothetical protein